MLVSEVQHRAKDLAMPSFAANVSLMFNEVPFLDRFARAAQAGFRGVEILFPYEFSPDDIAQQLQSNQLQNVLFNMPPGDWSGGERGLASIPGREQEFQQSVTTAVRYAKVLGAPCVHMLAGIPPAS